jgi:hypothetical protein
VSKSKKAETQDRPAGKSKKTQIIEDIFNARWDDENKTLSDRIVTLEQVSRAIREYNAQHPGPPLSDRNPANFFKDFIRNRNSANTNWPSSIFQRGYTARQRTGANECLEFVPVASGQTEPFPNLLPAPTEETPRRKIESVSMPLASRRLGRKDEPWLVQVLVRLRVIETHLALFSKRKIVQIDHLQMSVKLQESEIDALFLAIELVNGETPATTREVLVSCEAKGLRDDVLEDQVLRQVQTVFRMPGVPQDLVLPVAVKAFARSMVRVVEFDVVARADAPALSALSIVSDAVYELVPPVPGIGE